MKPTDRKNHVRDFFGICRTDDVELAQALLEQHAPLDSLAT